MMLRLGQNRISNRLTIMASMEKKRTMAGREIITHTKQACDTLDRLIQLRIREHKIRTQYVSLEVTFFI